MIAYMEKTTLNFANAFSIRQDLGIEGYQYSWVVASSALGLMIGAYPFSLAIQKFPLGKLMTGMIFLWGLLTMAAAASKGFGSLFALRFLLGVAEAAVGPAWLILTSMFYTRDEQPLRMCIYLGSQGLANIIAAGVCVGLGSVTATAVTPWQLIFLVSRRPSIILYHLSESRADKWRTQVVGALAIALSVVCLFLLPSSPKDARFLTKDEKLAAVWRIAQNQTGVKHEKVLTYQIREALCDIRVHCLLVQQFAIGMINGALGGYYSALLRGFGWSPIQTVRYQLPSGAVQLVASCIAGYLASRFRNVTIIIILVLAAFAVAALVGFTTIPAKDKWALTSCVWIVNAYGGAIVLNWAIVAANFAGHTKRSTINGINFVAYWGGNFAGPFVFNPAEAPRYRTATMVLGIMLGTGWLATAFMGINMWNSNRKRDAKAAAGRQEYAAGQGGVEGFADRTDKENKSFRYRY